MSALTSWLPALRDWALHTEASTRSLALLRMGLAITMWTRWASELLLYKHIASGHWPMCLLFFAATTLVLVGLWTRLSTVLMAVAALYLVYYIGHYEGHRQYMHHHTTLLAWSCVWLALTPCGKSYSVDRWLEVGRAERRGLPPPPEVGNLWGMRVMALQVSSVYLWSAVAKCTVGFLSGARLAHHTMEVYSGSSVIHEGLLAVLFGAVAWTTLLLEFGLAFGLHFARARRWLVLPGLALHAGFYVLLNVSTFSITMMVLYLAFFDPDAVHQLLDRMQGAPPLQLAADATGPAPLTGSPGTTRDLGAA
jgi:hypothetical protein